MGYKYKEAHQLSCVFLIGRKGQMQQLALHFEKGVLIALDQRTLRISLRYVVNKIISSQRCLHPNPQTCEYVTVYFKKGFTDVIKDP